MFEVLLPTILTLQLAVLHAQTVPSPRVELVAPEVLFGQLEIFEKGEMRMRVRSGHRLRL